MTHIYRDKTAPSHRILIPVNEASESNDGWSVKCIEVLQTTNHHIECRSTFIPVATLHRHYRREIL